MRFQNLSKEAEDRFCHFETSKKSIIESRSEKYQHYKSNISAIYNRVKHLIKKRETIQQQKASQRKTIQTQLQDSIKKLKSNCQIEVHFEIADTHMTHLQLASPIISPQILTFQCQAPAFSVKTTQDLVIGRLGGCTQLG